MTKKNQTFLIAFYFYELSLAKNHNLWHLTCISTCIVFVHNYEMIKNSCWKSRHRKKTDLGFQFYVKNSECWWSKKLRINFTWIFLFWHSNLQPSSHSSIDWSTRSSYPMSKLIIRLMSYIFYLNLILFGWLGDA